MRRLRSLAVPVRGTRAVLPGGSALRRLGGLTELAGRARLAVLPGGSALRRLGGLTELAGRARLTGLTLRRLVLTHAGLSPLLSDRRRSSGAVHTGQASCAGQH